MLRVASRSLAGAMRARARSYRRARKPCAPCSRSPMRIFGSSSPLPARPAFAPANCMHCAGGTSILTKGEVKIETRVDAYGEEDVTKTAAGMRTIPLAQPLILMLKEWKLRTKRKKADELVFPNKRGWYTGHDNMIKRKFLPLFDLLAEKHRQDPTQHPEAARAV